MLKRNILIKVCGMRDPENIQELASLPLDYIGHIFYPKSARYVGNLPSLADAPGLMKTGVFVNASLSEIKSAIEQYRLKVIQLHGDESPALAKDLKGLGMEVIKAFGIDEDFDWSKVSPFLDQVDYFLFDSKSAAYGGTGHTFNWEKLTSYPYEKPYFLSGGLSLENLSEAMAFDDARLIGLDLNSKFELEPGLKDIEKIKEALKTIHHE